MIPIVLTGTIAPNTLPVVHRDPQQRGREYRDAIQHYLGVGPVYFLENSGSPLLDDPFFSATPGLQTVRFPPSLGTRQGKGYQEFEMLDAFVSKTLAADAFIKITGRYIYRNIGALLPWCVRQCPLAGIVIDMRWARRVASVSLFAVSRRFYLEHLLGAYREMDDATNRWAEHVVYDRVRTARAGVFFRPAPVLRTTTGSTGEWIDMPLHGRRQWARNARRHLAWMMGMRRLPW